ncbi:hypothetical protein D3C73_1220770 [compost metagenome]
MGLAPAICSLFREQQDNKQRCRRGYQQDLRQLLPTKPGTERRQQLEIAIPQPFLPGHQPQTPIEQPQHQVTGDSAEHRITQKITLLQPVPKQAAPQQRQSQDIRQYLMAKIDDGQREQQGARNHHHHPVRSRGQIAGQQGGDNRHRQLNRRVSPADSLPAIATAPGQKQPTEQRNIIVTGDGMFAVGAM